MIRPALEDTLTDFDIVSTDVLAGRNLLWLVWDGTEIYAAVVTSLVIANGRKSCIIVACGGRGVDEWLHLISKIEDFARAEGCQSMAIMGRAGWHRKLKAYRVTSTTIEKGL